MPFQSSDTCSHDHRGTRFLLATGLMESTETFLLGNTIATKVCSHIPHDTPDRNNAAVQAPDLGMGSG